MPEGPEVRRHADSLVAALVDKPVVTLSARTKAARAWLTQNPDVLCGRLVQQVRSHGKNLIGRIEGGFYFYSHLMMWGRWDLGTGPPPVQRDRLERARIVVPDAYALLFSAPVFEVGAVDPFREHPYLLSLGPDILPYPEEGTFQAEEFLRRLQASEHEQKTIGAALLDQRIIAGIGNYLRAEILFCCQIDPWRPITNLSATELQCLCQRIPEIAQSAYRASRTVSQELRERMLGDPSLTYRPASDGGSRHFVFRRTNLPCLVCGDIIRQERQVTWEDEEGERERIIYFCPTCQKTAIPARKPRKRKQAV